jgi:hypothetical protein
MIGERAIIEVIVKGSSLDFQPASVGTMVTSTENAADGKRVFSLS